MNDVLLEEPVRANKSGIAIVDPDGRILEVNQRFSWLSGVPEDCRGDRIFDLIEGWKHSGVKEGIRVLSQTACPERLSMDVTVRGKRFSAQMYRLPSAGEDRLMITMEEAEDTRNVETLQWASTQDALRSRFDHDVRSRLNVILGYCAMLIEDLSIQDDSGEALEDLRCIVTAGNDLLSLNRKNSDLQRLIQGNLRVDVREVYPTDVLADLVKSVRSSFPEHTVALEADDSSFSMDAGLFGKLADSVLFRLCQEVSAESRIRLVAGRNEDTGAYEVLFSCAVPARMTAEREKLQNVISQILKRTKSDSRVPDLDLFYVDTLCALLNARIEASFDEENGQGVVKIELPNQGSPE